MIQFAILGLLNWQSFSGYDLKKIIAESDLFYWSGNNNQVYKSLISLYKAGWVTQEVHYQESLPAKKIYSITEAGRLELRKWVLSTFELPEFHNTFLIQLAWSEMLSDEELDRLLTQYEEEIGVQLSMHQEQARRPAAVPERSAREAYVWRKIAQNIELGYQKELDWVRQVRKDLAENLIG